MGIIQKLRILAMLGILGEVHGNLEWTEDSKDSIYFDHFVFSQLWPTTLCLPLDNGTTGGCNQTIRDQWMIHGLWPGKFHTLDVQYCDNTSIFDPTSIDSIREEMKIKWLEWMPANDHDEVLALWKHEWEKHGTCSTSLEILNTQTKYFEKGLQLYDNHNMNKILARANILPGNQYSIEDLLARVGGVLGKRLILHCSGSNTSYLEEIWICFDKSMNLIHCDDVYNFPTDCPREREILYPEYPRNDYNIRSI
ncbi:ribonuclease Oy-like isoform X2 [Fopius arisanus]|uniref:Ribonuclease Oy-like isoform X2 n=1 Tax=Fopius arisanus TaxID=64838 RepID=A0A9R1TS69_9HYME|nr:PREDICTED: ribonuclease Oy-like isoform X2 [Fopius arisanus]